MPSKSEKQRRFMGSELARKRAGEKTETGMTEEQLEDFASKSLEKSINIQEDSKNMANNNGNIKKCSTGAKTKHSVRASTRLPKPTKVRTNNPNVAKVKNPPVKRMNIKKGGIGGSMNANFERVVGEAGGATKFSNKAPNIGKQVDVQKILPLIPVAVGTVGRMAAGAGLKAGAKKVAVGAAKQAATNAVANEGAKQLQAMKSVNNMLKKAVVALVPEILKEMQKDGINIKKFGIDNVRQSALQNMKDRMATKPFGSSNILPGPAPKGPSGPSILSGATPSAAQTATDAAGGAGAAGAAGGAGAAGAAGSAGGALTTLAPAAAGFNPVLAAGLGVGGGLLAGKLLSGNKKSMQKAVKKSVKKSVDVEKFVWGLPAAAAAGVGAGLLGGKVLGLSEDKPSKLNRTVDIKKKRISKGTKGALIGGGVGGAVGTALGGKSTKGKIIGGLIGAGAGALGGNYIQNRNKPKSTVYTDTSTTEGVDKSMRKSIREIRKELGLPEDKSLSVKKGLAGGLAGGALGSLVGGKLGGVGGFIGGGAVGTGVGSIAQDKMSKKSADKPIKKGVLDTMAKVGAKTTAGMTKRVGPTATGIVQNAGKQMATQKLVNEATKRLDKPQPVQKGKAGAIAGGVLGGVGAHMLRGKYPNAGIGNRTATAGGAIGGAALGSMAQDRLMGKHKQKNVAVNAPMESAKRDSLRPPKDTEVSPYDEELQNVPEGDDDEGEGMGKSVAKSISNTLGLTKGDIDIREAKEYFGKHMKKSVKKSVRKSVSLQQSIDKAVDNSCQKAIDVQKKMSAAKKLALGAALAGGGYLLYDKYGKPVKGVTDAAGQGMGEGIRTAAGDASRTAGGELVKRGSKHAKKIFEGAVEGVKNKYKTEGAPQAEAPKGGNFSYEEMKPREQHKDYSNIYADAGTAGVGKSIQKSGVKKSMKKSVGTYTTNEMPKKGTSPSLKGAKCKNCGSKITDEMGRHLTCSNCGTSFKKSFLSGDNSVLTSTQKKTVRDNKEYHEEINDTLTRKQPEMERSELDMSKSQASLRVEKAIFFLNGYDPMSDASVKKSFHGQIPDIMNDIESRPPLTWWEKAINKAMAFTDDPVKYSTELWYDINKAVAEPLESKFQPTQKGEENQISDGTRVDVSDLAGKGKSEMTETL